MKGGKRLSEHDILTLIKGRDPSAMRLLYDSYIGYMAAVCARYVPNADDRKDVLQESFIKIMTSIAGFNHSGEGSLKNWMVRITVNESLNHLRRNAAGKLVDYGDALPDVAEETDVGDIPDEELNRMILRLPPGYRMVFNLYVFENKSHKEIAKTLGIAENTSASQYLRAKAALAKMINEYRTTHLNE